MLILRGKLLFIVSGMLYGVGLRLAKFGISMSEIGSNINKKVLKDYENKIEELRVKLNG